VSWLAMMLASGPGSSVTPIASAASDILSYILGYGVLGVVALAMAFRYLIPRSSHDAAIKAARADLLDELERVRAEKVHAEQQRDEALRVAQTELVPLLSTFTAATTALLPLLQELVRHQEGERGHRPPGRSPR
jgi:hypothetical protein